MKKILTQSQKDTIDFGKSFVSELKGGEVIALNGELGAGKTTFTKGLARGLKISKPITSPTFVLMKVYDTKHGKIKKMIHIDCYRLSDADELSAIGIEEYFGKPDTVVLIEWADKIKKILPKKKISINIKLKNQDTREIIIK